MFKRPQHSTAPLVRSPQLVPLLVVTALKLPAGVQRSIQVEPQQVTVLSVRIPQVW